MWRQNIWKRPAPIWAAIRAILFEPVLTAQRGTPWEDIQ